MNYIGESTIRFEFGQGIPEQFIYEIWNNLDFLPFILFTAYRAGTGEYAKHKKLARFTWPVWFYVAVSGVLVYLLIEPYYA